MPRSTYGKALGLFLIIVFVTVITQSFIRPTAGDYEAPASAECVGTPIKVDYPFAGGFLEPHACASQCQDMQQHYILYDNGKATQCQILPGCLDWGEDRGVTCVVPGTASSTSSQMSSLKTSSLSSK